MFSVGWVLVGLTVLVIEHNVEAALRHANGRHMCRIYGPADMTSRGGTTTFNLYYPD